ncbi:MAG: hypothetical protein DI537_17515 [Stutzerimonas stutzeri]|nr:MAG: hypothetical protein DI537_17515 [Stutzerimonas stutzeri]
MAVVSRLGLEIETALKAHPLIRPHGPAKLYLQAYVTNGGFVFAAERVTISHINLWTPPDHRVWKEAQAIGAAAEVREPFDKPDPEKYGRLSSLEYVNELAYLTLFCIPVASAADALEVVAPLLKRSDRCATPAGSEPRPGRDA